MMGYTTRDENTCLCNFHPKEVVVGVCALCLREKLLVLASKQDKRDQKYHSSLLKEKKSSDHHYLPKMFAFSSLLSNIRHGRKVEEINDDASTCSREDSFISIKFENNGVASWEKGGAKVMSLKHMSCKRVGANAKLAVIEHAKPRLPQLRWRKRIGHIFQLIRFKRSNKGNNICHVGTKLEGVKVRHGWIRSLTKRKTKE